VDAPFSIAAPAALAERQDLASASARRVVVRPDKIRVHAVPCILPAQRRVAALRVRAQALELHAQASASVQVALRVPAQVDRALEWVPGRVVASCRLRERRHVRSVRDQGAVAVSNTPRAKKAQ
jgi:hypothetical protein